MVTGTAPGFVDPSTQDFRLLLSSPAVNAGTNLHPDTLSLHNVIRHYVRHQAGEARPVSGPFDLGAFEFASVVPMQINTVSLPNALRGRSYHQTLQASGGSGAYIWSISAGTLPAGLVLDPASGVVRGRARLKGHSNFTITVQDAQNQGASASLPYSLETFLHIQP